MLDDRNARERYEHLVSAYREAKATRTLRKSMSRFSGNRIAASRGNEVRTAAEQLLAGVGRAILAEAGFGDSDIAALYGPCLDHPEGAADALVGWMESQATQVAQPSGASPWPALSIELSGCSAKPGVERVRRLAQAAKFDSLEANPKEQCPSDRNLLRASIALDQVLRTAEYDPCGRGEVGAAHAVILIAHQFSELAEKLDTRGGRAKILSEAIDASEHETGGARR